MFERPGDSRRRDAADVDAAHLQSECFLGAHPAGEKGEARHLERRQGKRLHFVEEPRRILLHERVDERAALLEVLGEEARLRHVLLHELPIQRVVEDLAAEFEDFVLHIGPGNARGAERLLLPSIPLAHRLLAFPFPFLHALVCPPPRNLGHLKQASLHVHRRQIAKGDKPYYLTQVLGVSPLVG